MREETAVKSKPIDQNGKLYQRRAYQALPLLVRQARAGQTIYYGDLAAELGMPNARNLNFVLGSVGVSLQALSRTWGHDVPPVQALVVNQHKKLPGIGFATFAPDPEVFRAAPTHQRQLILQQLLGHVFLYDRWPEVLAHFGIAPPEPPDIERLLPPDLRIELVARPESEAHRALKELVRSLPHLVGYEGRLTAATVEFPLLSGDRVDVLVETDQEFLAVEVKSRLSPPADLLRGLFQCVKYAAVLTASQVVKHDSRTSRSLLALESVLPSELRPIANALGVRVHEGLAREPGAV